MIFARLMICTSSNTNGRLFFAPRKSGDHGNKTETIAVTDVETLADFWESHFARKWLLKLHPYTTSLAVTIILGDENQGMIGSFNECKIHCNAWVCKILVDLRLHAFLIYGGCGYGLWTWGWGSEHAIVQEYTNKQWKKRHSMTDTNYNIL